MPFAIEELGALIVMDCNAAAVTVSVRVFDVIPFWLAEMLLEPVPTPVLKPPADMLAAPGFEEVQEAEAVMSCVLPSVKVAIAVNWAVLPFVMD